MWASVPLLIGTILTVRPCLSAKPGRLTISEKPASPLGSITPRVQGLSCSAPPAGAATSAASAEKTAAPVVALKLHRCLSYLSVSSLMPAASITFFQRASS